MPFLTNEEFAILSGAVQNAYDDANSYHNHDSDCPRHFQMYSINIGPIRPCNCKHEQDYLEPLKPAMRVLSHYRDTPPTTESRLQELLLKAGTLALACQKLLSTDIWSLSGRLEEMRHYLEEYDMAIVADVNERVTDPK